MSAQFIAPADVIWKPVNILRNRENPDLYAHRFDLPVPLADWDVFDYWERERFTSMAQRLGPGDVLYDVGTEHGWCNLLYAATGASLVLIEPTAEFWPNIRATWQRNYPGVKPVGFYDGLLSDHSTDDRTLGTDWPPVCDGPLIDRNKYEYVHQHTEGVCQTTVDDLVTRSAVLPTALTLDVEGAELLVLRGATQTLLKLKPLVWVSIHPDLGLRDYGVKHTAVHAFMESVKYTGMHLGTDHEQHWLFEPCR